MDHIPQNQAFSFWAAVTTSLLCVLFGGNAIAIKMSLFGFGVFTAAGFRFGIAAMVILFWVKTTGRSLEIEKGQTRQLLIISVIFLLQTAMLYIGINKTHASRAILLVNLQPFITLFLAHFFIPGDRITKRKLFGLLLGFGGVAFVFLDGTAATKDLRRGDLLILLASFLWSCQIVYKKRVIDAFKPFRIVFYQMLFASPVFILGGWIWDLSMIGELDAKVIAGLIYQGLVTGSLGFVLWNNLLQKHGAVALQSFIFIMPVSGVILGGLILDEPITSNLVLALLLIASGILVVHFKSRKPLPLILPSRGV